MRTESPVSGTHSEPDREADPVAFLRTLAVCLLLSVPLWGVIALVLRSLVQ